MIQEKKLGDWPMLMVVVEDLGFTGIYYSILASHTTKFELSIKEFMQ